MSALDTIFNILKGAHPDASDEDIKSYIDSAKASPDQMDSAVAPLSLSKDADPMAPKFQSANSTPASFDIGTSDNTVTQNGSVPSVTAEPAQVPAPPPSPTPDMGPVTPMPAPAPTSKAVDNSNEAAAAASVAKPDDSAAALKTALAPTSTKESDAEAAMKKKNKDLKLTGAVSGVVGGIGDAIGNAAIPFGGKGSSGTQERILENTNEQVDKNKAAFDEQEKKDPTSDISRHYQKVLGLMLGSHAKDMGVEKMSAEHIASTLPEVEKYMQKELGLKQIQSNKDLQMSMHEQGRQDKLEKDTREWVDNLSKARNGELGVQNGKVDQARHLLQAFKQAEDTGKPFTNATYREIAVGLANLMSNGGKTNADTEHAIAQATMKGDINKALTYAGMDPQTLGGTTDSMMKTLKESILRQGMEAQKQRDKFINDQKAIAPSGLNKTQSDRILNQQYGNSINEFLPQPKAAGAPPKATSPEGTVKTIGTRQFTVMNGIWHEVSH